MFLLASSSSQPTGGRILLPLYLYRPSCNKGLSRNDVITAYLKGSTPLPFDRRFLMHGMLFRSENIYRLSRLKRLLVFDC